MKHLLKWEMKQSFKSKTFWGFGITFVLATFFLNLMDIFEKNDATGLDLLLTSCSNINSFFLLSFGIFAGMHVAGAFEERRIQAAVMAGNSRWNIVLAKFLSFAMAIAIFAATSVGLSAIPAFLHVSEAGVESVGTLIVQCILYVFAQISFLSICFVISMYVKRLGASIGINLVVLLIIDLCGELVVNKPWGENIVRHTAFGQTVFSFMESSPASMMTSIWVSALGILITVAIAYIMFRKEELK